MKMNVAQHAAIYGNDGTLWASSSDWPGFSEYDFEMETEDGSKQTIKINEFNCAMQVSSGRRMPTAAGVRMLNSKFIMTTYDAETQSASCTRLGGGGATVCKFKNGFLLSIWDKNAIMTNNMNQNAGDSGMMCEKVAKLLKDAGY